MTKKPKDLRLGEIAYETFYERPQVAFDDLNHDAQMKWVKLCRKVIEEWRNSTPGNVVERKTFELEREVPPKRVMHKKAKGRYAKSRKGTNLVPLEEKVKDWDRNDEEDRKILTGKSPQSKVEIAALARMRYRNKQRMLNGLEAKPIEP
jgi:hypothetical protein